MARDAKTQHYMSKLSDVDKKIVGMFNMGISTTNISLKVDRIPYAVSVVIGRYIHHLKEVVRERRKHHNKEVVVLMGKKEPYHLDERMYGQEMKKATYYDLSFDEQMIYLT